MNKILPFALAFLIFISCTQRESSIVSETFLDSAMVHFTVPELATQNEKEMQFWKARINPASPGFLNESRYAGCLNMRFRFFGDIVDIKMADSILYQVDRALNYRESATDIALASHCITEHQFMRADSFLLKAKRLGLKPYESNVASFDVDVELGKYTEAKAELNAISSPQDYGYLFRKSKLEHLAGNLDSSIAYMLAAADAAGSSLFLKGVALANAADLCIHAGKLQDANNLYVQCVKINAADFHSMMGLGWIALVHDKNSKLAHRIFQFVASKNKLPDATFKLSQWASAIHDTVSWLHYAKEFEGQATGPLYGGMYAKYLLQLYSTILNSPLKAEKMSQEELTNRATPQTYAWYAWALFNDGKKQQAYAVFQQHVSGQLLEGLELYWMGRLMEGLNKKYDANQFFKAAYLNQYDLDPGQREYVENRLAE